MSFRKILFWTHLVTGVAAGVVVLLMSVTGVALTYQRQLEDLSRSDYRTDAVARAGRPLSSDELLAALERQQPGFEPSSLTYRADAAEPALLGQGRRGRLYVDRYTGEVLGDGSSATGRFMRLMVDWHRWLGQEGEGRAVGRAITGASNLAFLFLIVSGAYLWWPRNWSARALRNAMWFRAGLRGKARDFNWHNAIGFLTAIPLAVVVASGVVISYGWAGDLVYTLTGSEPPARGRGGPRGGPPERTRSGSAETPADTPRLSFDALLEAATSHTPGWRSATLSLPRAAGEPVRISIDTSPGGQPAARSELVLDPATGEVLSRSGYADQSPGQRLRGWLRFAHTGEVYGTAGQTVAGVASLGASVLVWTGLALTWRRFFGARTAARRARAARAPALVMSWEQQAGDP